MKTRLLVSVYLDAKEVVLEGGHSEEIAWQMSRSPRLVTETDFLREAAWVILSAGLSSRVVDRVFPGVSEAYYDWNVDAIVAADVRCCESLALRSFSHPGKIHAITALCLNLYQVGLDAAMEALRAEGPAYLTGFDFIGPVTCRHLAKNLGLEVAKPDRHLLRIVGKLGWSDVQEMCAAISEVTGDSIAVVDLVFWRFAESTPGYLGVLDESIARWSDDRSLSVGDITDSLVRDLRC